MIAAQVTLEEKDAIDLENRCLVATSHAQDAYPLQHERPQMARSNSNPAAGTLPTFTSDTIRMAFREIMDDEAQHVSFFQDAMKKAGATPRPKPTFKGLEQHDVDDFIAMSSTLENTGVGAFLMAMPAISDRNYTPAAASILTIEARHAGFVNALLGKDLSPNGAFDKPIPHAAIIKAASPFIESLNGGPDPADKLDSDVTILNFALLLEHLEAEFYRVNVPRLFE